MFVGILTSRFVLKALGVADYGLYNVIGGIVGMMAFVSTMMNATTYRFLAYEQGKPDGDVNKVFNISLTLHLIAALAILVLALTIGVYYIGNYLVVEEGKLADAYFVLLFSVINIIGMVIGMPFSGLLIANEKFAITVPIEIGTKVMVLLVAILVNIIPTNHLRVYVVLITLVHWINPLAYSFYCVRNFYTTVKWRFQKELSCYKEMFRYTGWNSIEVAAHMGEHQGSAILINRFFGTVLNASFGVANQLNAMVKMFANGLGQAVIPQITKSYSAGDHNRSSQLVILASKFSFFLMAIPMLPILLETEYILSVWLVEVPRYAPIFVKAMLIKSIIGTSQYGIAHLIHASGNLRLFTILSSSVRLLSLPIAYLAFRLGYPPYVISYLFIVVAIFNFAINQISLKTVLNYDSFGFLTKSTVRIVSVCLFQIPLFMAVRLLQPGFWRFIGISVAAELVLFGSVYFIGMNVEERKRVLGYAKEVLSRLTDRH
jgi:O-antigen/teichoic acid export membrane protein